MARNNYLIMFSKSFPFIEPIYNLKNIHNWRRWVWIQLVGIFSIDSVPIFNIMSCDYIQ